MSVIFLNIMILHWTILSKELNLLIEKKCQKFVKNKKMRKTEEELQHVQEMQISDDESKKYVSSVIESVESGEILFLSSE